MEEQKRQPEKNRRSFVYNSKENSFYCPQEDSTFSLGEKYGYDEQKGILYDKSGYIKHLNEDNFLYEMYLCKFYQIIADFEKNGFNTADFKTLIETDLEFLAQNPKELCRFNTELNKFFEQKKIDLPYFIIYSFNSAIRYIEKQKKITDQQKMFFPARGKRETKESRLKIQDKRITSMRERIRAKQEEIPDEKRLHCGGKLLSETEIFQKIYMISRRVKYKGGPNSPFSKIYKKIENLKYVYNVEHNDKKVNLKQALKEAFKKRYNRWLKSIAGRAFKTKWSNHDAWKIIIKVCSPEK